MSRKRHAALQPEWIEAHVSHQVLARKWRPKTFTELVGQEHVVKVLTHGLDEGRIHHAFLFTGTRGVGKTTMARILAKSLNCLEGVSAQPCGVCEHCTAIDEGRFVDLMEIDAASRTKVDDTRDILDNVPYAPAQGRYKVYLIDEVHMLSMHSFNALLKTLEEPPEHVKFVLATTHPQKIPVTILSRCLQFNLRRLSVDQITQQLQQIVQSEGFQAEEDALKHIAVAADGSMRDGLSLLDQAIATEDGLTLDNIQQMLGSVEQGHVHALLKALAKQQPAEAMAVIDEVFAQARDLGQLLVDLAEALHRIGLILALPDYRDDSRSDWDSLVGLAAQFDPEDVQLFYEIVIRGRKDLELAPSPKTGCQMTILRLFAFAPTAAPATDVASGPAGGSPKQAVDAGQTAAEPPAGPTTTAQPVDAPLGLVPDQWAQVLESLPLNGSVRAVAGLLVVEHVSHHNVVFGVTADYKELMTERFKTNLTSALSEFYKADVKIEIAFVNESEQQTPADLAHQEQADAQAAAQQAIETDPVVNKLKERFDAQVLTESIRPVGTRSH